MRCAHAAARPTVAVVGVEVHACAVAARVGHITYPTAAAAVVAAAGGVDAYPAGQHAHRTYTRTTHNITVKRESEGEKGGRQNAFSVA